MLCFHINGKMRQKTTATLESNRGTAMNMQQNAKIRENFNHNRRNRKVF